jgi:deoxyribodipyrimidine photo-lyase
MGWWGLSEPAEMFLDQLVTWRELGYNFCSHRVDYDRYESLPVWALTTLEKHAPDPRPHRYALPVLEAGETHDPLWNAIQRQLVRDGWFHNYLRMLWGKKILEWSTHPRDALDAMVQLMNRYSLDGRNPNSYTGYFWVLGRYDRPWGPERPIFGTVRYMSSASTARKVRVREYLRRYAP